jgi:alpha-L-fucosidase
MKKKSATFFVLLAMLFVSSFWASISTQDPKTRIIEASDALFNTGTAKISLVDSLIQLLDVAVALTSTSQYKDEIAHHVEVAKDLIENTSLFNDKARQYLCLAYRMITNGQKYQRPEELDEFVTPSEAQQKAMKYAKNLIEESLVELESGYAENAAKSLLELVIMVVTPVSG